jgi:phosphoesterase RecJ-like protein
MSENGRDPAFGQVVDELTGRDKFLLVTHEHPDGDALGSIVAMRAILDRTGKDALMYIDPDEFPLPQEYGFLALEGLVGFVPEDILERTVVFLDCGNMDRNPFAARLPEGGGKVVNIDHHHDNTLFGDIDLVVAQASCTAEIVWELMHALGVEADLTIAQALYVGLVTDSGRFMYKNTGPKAHRMAAELLEAGVDPFAVYRSIYEGMPFGKLALLARGLSHTERHDGLTVTRLTAEDFRESGAEESYSEGVIDYLRAIEGTQVAALVRDRMGPGQHGLRKVSLRASDEAFDVSEIARSQGGGGHPQAAGFTTSMEWPELVAFLHERLNPAS